MARSTPGSSPNQSSLRGPVVVIGGGTMGAGITQTLLEVEESLEVHLVELDAGAAEAAVDRIRSGLLLRQKRMRDPEGAAKEILQRLTSHVSLPTKLVPELVIEVVPEDLELKTVVLRTASRAYPGCVLATNTSSLSIDGLARSVHRPARFVGMHFFNPVPLSELVEVVISTSSEPDAVDRSCQWVESFGKVAIRVKDTPGFVTSRLGVAMGLEAMRMVEEGVASPEDIDRGMVLGYKLPIGPLALSDLVGLDVRLAIADHLAAELGDRFQAPRILREKVASGKLGKKKGEGFYRWFENDE